MELEKARKLLGPKYSSLTDEQIREIEMLFRAVCRYMIRKHHKKSM